MRILNNKRFRYKNYADYNEKNVISSAIVQLELKKEIMAEIYLEKN